MYQGYRRGGPASCYADPARRASLLDLLDEGFPGLAARVAAAEASHGPWASVTEPFVRWEGPRAIGHVGVIAHRVRLAGATVEVAGVHAVCTRIDARGRGVARGLLVEACAWADRAHTTAKLFTDVPAVYASHGFREVPLHVFHVDRPGGEGGGRPLRADEALAFLALCAEREPVSDLFASLDPGWLVHIDLALQGRSPTALTAIDALGVVVDWRVIDGTLEVRDVFARTLPPLDALTRYAPPHERVVLSMTPDRLAPDARPVRVPGPMMVRGPWPLPWDLPLGVAPTAEH